jgi:hypothetical protein
VTFSPCHLSRSLQKVSEPPTRPRREGCLHRTRRSNPSPHPLMYHVFRGTEQLAQAGSRGFSILSAVRRGGNQVAKLPRRGRDLRGADGSVPNLRQEKQAQGVRSARRVPGPNELTCRGGWQGWQVDKGASRGVRDEGRRCLSLLGRQRAHDDSVVMVKNEEIVRSSVSALEYRALMESDGGKMGGAVTGWLRIGKGGVHGLGTFSNFAAGRVFERIIGTPRSELDTAGRAAADRRLGVMSFTCEPGALHSMLAENLRVAQGEMEARLGGDAEAATALREEGMVALAVVAWGSAPAQQGGRAAERRYTDLVVHLTPASDTWETPDLALEVVPPRGDAQKWSWARGGHPLEAAAVASGLPLEYAEEVAVEEQGRFKAPLQSTLAVRPQTAPV